MQKFFIKGLILLILATSFGGCSPNIQSNDEKQPQQDKQETFLSDGPTEVDNRKPEDLSFLEHGPRKKKMVSLTFDADMTPYMKKELEEGKVKSWYDEKIIKILKEENVPTTLFITGMWAEIYPEKVKEFSKNPLFEIASHSYDHAAFNMPCYGLSPASDKEMEVVKTQQVFKNLTGIAPKYFRFPGGCASEKDIKLVQKLGVRPVGWDVISGDAYLKDEAKIVERVLSEAQNGSIIVLHLHGGPHASKTSAALKDIIKGLKKKGFEFGTLSQLME